MQAVYILLCVLIGWEIVHRKIDFVSIAAASFILYSSNCIIGEVWVPQSGYYAYFAQIQTKTYILVFIQLFSIYFLLLMKRKKIHFVLGKIFRKKELCEHLIGNPMGNNNDNRLYWIAMIIVSVVSVFYNLLFKVGISTFFSYTAKSDILDETSFLFSLSIWGGLICLFHFYIVKNNYGVFLSAMVIIVSVILGGRAYLASAFVGLLIIKSFGWRKNNTSDNNIKLNKRIIILAILMFLFLIFYKLVYKEIRAGDISAAISVLTKVDTWKTLFDIDELRIVFADYNYTIEHNIKLSNNDVIARIVSLIPFANNFVPIDNPIRFSTILKNEMHTTYGLGSNFWGESYAMGGSIFLIMTTIAWLSVINGLNEKVRMTKSPFSFTIVSYLCFFIHRLDWTQVMGCLKLVFIFYLLKKIFDFFLKKSITIHVINRIGKERKMING